MIHMDASDHPESENNTNDAGVRDQPQRTPQRRAAAPLSLSLGHGSDTTAYYTPFSCWCPILQIRVRKAESKV